MNWQWNEEHPEKNKKNRNIDIKSETFLTSFAFHQTLTYSIS